jgi:hypothetical protein
LFDSSGTLLRLAVTCLGLVFSTGAFLAVAMLLRLGEARQILSTVLDLIPGRSDRGGQ